MLFLLHVAEHGRCKISHQRTPNALGPAALFWECSPHSVVDTVTLQY